MRTTTHTYYNDERKTKNRTMIRRRFLNDFNEFKTNVPLPQRSRILRLTKFEVRPGGGGSLISNVAYFKTYAGFRPLGETPKNACGA